MDIKVKINNFDVPTEVYQQGQVGLRQNGFVTSPSWKLSELDEDTLSDLCDQFRKDVFKRANKKDPTEPGYKPF